MDSAHSSLAKDTGLPVPCAFTLTRTSELAANGKQFRELRFSETEGRFPLISTCAERTMGEAVLFCAQVRGPWPGTTFLCFTTPEG